MAMDQTWPKNSPKIRTALRGMMLWVGALALIAGTAGCHVFHSSSAAPEPPDYLKVTSVGISRPGDERPFDSFQQALGGALVTESHAALDGKIADPAQRVLMARAAARRAALRGLGQKITAVTDKQGQRLADRLKDYPAKQAMLNELLENMARVTYQEKDESTLARAQLGGAQVYQILNANPPVDQARQNAPQTPEQTAQRKRLAYDKALREVKAMLREKALNIELSDKRLVKDALADDQSATQELDALIFLAQPDETQYLPDGSCEMTIYFDRNRVRELAERRHHGGWFGWLHF